MIELLLQAEQVLSLGLLDEAERLYSLAAEGDPNNAIAIVGLSRVALERGDERTALALARKALAIDPESPTATRMRDRLEEVIVWRGEEIPAEGGPGAPAESAAEAAATPGAAAPVAAGTRAAVTPALPDPARPIAGPEAPAAPPPDTIMPPKQSPTRGLLRRLTRRS